MKLYQYLILENVTKKKKMLLQSRECIWQYSNYVFNRFNWAGKCSVHVRNRFIMLNFLPQSSNSTEIIYTDAQTTLRKYFLDSQNIPSLVRDKETC